MPATLVTGGDSERHDITGTAGIQPENPTSYLYPFSELPRFTPLLFSTGISWILVAITLFDAVRHTGTKWDQTDQDQLLWTIVILSIGGSPAETSNIGSDLR